MNKKDLSFIAEALAADRLNLLKRVSDWFKAYYSYIQLDKDVMRLWKEIDDELDAEEIGE